MDAAAGRIEPGQGIRRLLEHCETLDRLTEGKPASARTRLETALGCELAQLLVGALSARAHGRGRVAL